RRAVRAVARPPLPRPEGARARPGPRAARRPAQRRPLRLPHARRGTGGGDDPPAIRAGVPPGRHPPPRAGAVGGRPPAPPRHAAAAVRLTARRPRRSSPYANETRARTSDRVVAETRFREYPGLQWLAPEAEKLPPAVDSAGRRELLGKEGGSYGRAAGRLRS